MRFLIIFLAMTGLAHGEETAPEQILTSVGMFAFGGIGYSGGISAGEAALEEVLGMPGRDQILARVYKGGTLAAQCYVLATYRKFDYARYRRLVKEREGETTKVWVGCGCTVWQTSFAQVVKWMREGRLRIPEMAIEKKEQMKDDEPARDVASQMDKTFDVVDITACPQNPEDRKSLSVSKGKTVSIELPDGRASVLQFTAFGDSFADYRWRFRASPEAPTFTGTGRVFEKYKRVKQPDGTMRVTIKHKPEDLKIKAGEIWLEWSYGGVKSGWLYYCPARAKVEMIASTPLDFKR